MSHSNFANVPVAVKGNSPQKQKSPVSSASSAAAVARKKSPEHQVKKRILSKASCKQGGPSGAASGTKPRKRKRDLNQEMPGNKPKKRKTNSASAQAHKTLSAAAAKSKTGKQMAAQAQSKSQSKKSAGSAKRLSNSTSGPSKLKSPPTGESSQKKQPCSRMRKLRGPDTRKSRRLSGIDTLNRVLHVDLTPVNQWKGFIKTGPHLCSSRELKDLLESDIHTGANLGSKLAQQYLPTTPVRQTGCGSDDIVLDSRDYDGGLTVTTDEADFPSLRLPISPGFSSPGIGIPSSPASGEPSTPGSHRALSATGNAVLACSDNNHVEEVSIAPFSERLGRQVQSSIPRPAWARKLLSDDILTGNNLGSKFASQFSRMDADLDRRGSRNSCSLLASSFDEHVGGQQHPY